VMVTNQDGLGSPGFPERKFLAPHNKMLRILRGEGIRFDEVRIDRSMAGDASEFRKPGTGMVAGYVGGTYDMENSIMIGDRISDMEFARRLECRGIWFADPGRASELPVNLKETVILISKNWGKIGDTVTRDSRRVKVARKTRETDIRLRLNPDGSGVADIDTGLRFLDHMLNQLACHSGMDLSLTCRGDLDVDEHHTIEDCALALGEGIRRSLGNKKGIRRFGFLLPMDDSLARVALDLGGRSWLNWDCRFSGHRIGGVPTAMFEHFFRSFAQAAHCTLHISVTGTNDHHRIESVFKALARALGDAVEKTVNPGRLPSTKGRI